VAHGHTLSNLLLVWCSSHNDLVPGEMSLCAVTRNVMCQCEMLWTGVKGSCLHRPENWLLRKLLICEARPIHKVGFIREKGKATGRAMQAEPRNQWLPA
jgi:hypothetical protein